MKRLFALLCCGLAAVSSFSQPKNIIIVMADGVGFNQSKLVTGKSDCKLNQFDVSFAVANYPTYWNTLDEEFDVQYYRGDYHVRRVWQEFDYADNLPINPTTAGSALATGVKPALNAVSHDMDGTELETILERAVKEGKTTALATNGSIKRDNAVLPFACHAKVAGEGDYPALFAQLLDSDVDMIISSDLSELASDKWLFADKVEALPASLEKPVVFGNAALGDETFCAASEVSLNLLAQNPNGFVFVGECANIEDQFGSESFDVKAEMKKIDDYVSRIYSWVEANSNWNETLMIVVGTYEKGYLTSRSFNKEKPEKQRANFLVKDENDLQFNSQHNTNLLTPMFAKGQGSELFAHYADETDFVFGSYINNTEIAQLCFRLMPDGAKSPKNIIFMVNDGCGICPIMAADFYTGKTASFENFPVKLWNCTHASATSKMTNNLSEWNNTYESRLAWTGKDYLWKRKNATCSGASGTAMATGKKTYYYSLGVDVYGNATKSVGRYAKELGKAAGVATNSTYFDATPGAFFTNNASRENYNDLSRQVIIESNADVVIGCGHPEFDNNAQKKATPDYKKIGGVEMLEGLRAGAAEYAIASNSGWNTVRDIDGDGEPDPWTFVEDSASLVHYMTGETPKRLFAMIPAESSMQFYRDGIDVNEVHYDDWNAGMPQLWQIGKVALNCVSKNPNGFFLLIENDMVDNGGHKNRPGRQMEEQLEFNKTVDSVIAWVERHSSWDETLLIITADHETGLMADPTFGEDSIMLNHWCVIDNGVGNMPGLKYYATDHSNQLVPFFAKGAGSELFERYADEWDFVRGKYLNNSEIGQTMFELWGGKACQILNALPKANFFDTLFVKQEVDFSFELPDDVVLDEEDEVQIKMKSKPMWVKYDAETNTISGHSPRTLGTSNINFTASDGATTGAGLTLEYSIKICVYKEMAPDAVAEAEKESALVYPTITTEKLTVKAGSVGGEVVVRDMQGQVVLAKKINGNSVEIDTKQLRAGEYIVQIIEGENVTNKKVIIR